MKRVAVIGGGISGLATAWQLARDGQCEVELFEASARLGGIVETARVETADGLYIIECGPDAWVTEKPWARELAIEFDLEDEIISSNDSIRRTYLQQGKQLTPIPDGMRMMVPTRWAPILESPLFSWQARLAYLREPRQAEALKAAALPDGEDESVASFVRRHFGEEVTRTAAAPLLAGIFGGDIDRLSARAVMPAFLKMEREHGSLITALQSKQGKQGEPAAIFTTLHNGLQTLIDRMQVALPSQAIRLNTAVRSISTHDGRWQVSTDLTTESYDSVILATPPHVTRELLRPLQEEFASLLNIESTSAIVVALGFSREQSQRLRIPRGFGYLVSPMDTAPAGEPQLLACTFMNQKYVGRAPEGTVLLRAFFGGKTAKALLDWDDASLAALARQRLSEMLGPLPEPSISIVRRWPLSLPQYTVGHGSRITQLSSLLTKFPGLRLVGNAYSGVGLPDLIRQGRDAARDLAADLQTSHTAAV